MDSVEYKEDFDPWNGEVEPLFRAMEAAIEAAEMMAPGWAGGVLGWDGGLRWRLSEADLSSVLTAARKRIKHGQPPTSVDVWTNQRARSTGITLHASRDVAYISGSGTDPIRARRAVDAARVVLMEQARGSQSDASPVVVSEPDPTPEKPQLSKGIVAWMEAHPVVMGSSVLAAIIAALTLVLTRVL